MTVSFQANKTEMRLIQKIATRAVALFASHGVALDQVETQMDMTAVHANGCPIDLAKLLNAPDFDFAHDVGGIRGNLNRKTGQLENCFVPRCAGKVLGEIEV